MNKRPTRGRPPFLKRRTDFAQFVHQLIDTYEKTPDGTIQINMIAAEQGVEKRRLYDLMNVLVACDVCVKTDTHLYRWLSISNTSKAVQRISKDMELRAMTMSVSELLTLPDSPPIGLMTTVFIGTFLFFNMSTMNIRDVALLLSSVTNQQKQILRRLYLVAFLLERIGLLKHKQKIGDYEINANVEAICLESLQELSREGMFPPSSVEYHLNRFDENFVRALFRQREDSLMLLKQSKWMHADEGDLVLEDAAGTQGIEI